ncbi:AMP-binding protein, partial [bacterium]|nr:AMP-binding protein [bacterium]
MFQNTIYQRFEDIALEMKNHTALAYLFKNRYQEISYRKLNDLVLKLVNYFLDIGLNKGDRVIVLSENRWQWPVIDLACNYLGLILVPIHTTYSEKYIDYIISETKPKLAFISNQELINNFFKIKKELIESFLEIIVFEKDIQAGFKVKYFKELINKYSDDVDQNPISDSGAIMTIIYTSGTTGMPKGAMLSNQNIITNLENVTKYVPIKKDDRFFSVLPLSHILERMAGQITPLLMGSSIYYARSPKTLKDDIKKAKPTIFVSVPRIFEKIFDAIHDKLKISPRISHYLFYRALKVT